MKYVRSALAGIVAVLLTFAVVAILVARNREGVLGLFVLVVMVRPIWLIVAGVFLGGFVLRLWIEDRTERNNHVSTDNPTG